MKAVFLTLRVVSSDVICQMILQTPCLTQARYRIVDRKTFRSFYLPDVNFLHLLKPTGKCFHLSFDLHFFPTFTSTTAVLSPVFYPSSMPQSSTYTFYLCHFTPWLNSSQQNEQQIINAEPSQTHQQKVEIGRAFHHLWSYDCMALQSLAWASVIQVNCNSVTITVTEK